LVIRSAIQRDGRVVLGRVGDAEPAAEVHLGHDVPARAREVGVQRQHGRRRDLEAGGVEDLAADVAVQAEQLQPGCASTDSSAVRGLERTAPDR
jgi:hypothetical protein